jgi:hypothetical protein
MADETSASVIPLHQPRPKKARTSAKNTAKTPAKTSAEVAKAYQQRKRRKTNAAASENSEEPSSASLIPPEFLSANSAYSELPGPASPATSSHGAVALERPKDSTEGQKEGSSLDESSIRVAPPSRRHAAASVLLTVAALALAGVGITMNGWFARSLGSSDIAGWLFLAIGVAADLVALVMPSCAAGLWQAGQRATALVGWGIWLMTFVFAITAGIGFASVNIADATLARSNRVTPAVTTAQAALTDAMAARDRECKGGVGKFCREREAAVAERRQAVDAAMNTVAQTADPQTEAAIRIVAWVSGGMLRPTSDDFAMLRLVLLALLPQIGGILLMVGRVQHPSAVRVQNR